jgi:hypothetical protein
MKIGNAWLKLNSRAAKTPVSMGSSRQLRRVIGKIFRMPPGESGVLTKRGPLSEMETRYAARVKLRRAPAPGVLARQRRVSTWPRSSPYAPT